MPPTCIFCDHDSGSPEHLWPDWMHNTVKFAPINMQEADGPIITGQDPEQTITTVCQECNTAWMSLIEHKASTRLKPMLLNQPIEIDRGGMKLLTQWTVLRAMVFESMKPKSGNEQFFTREERVAFKANRTVPERTRVWVPPAESLWYSATLGTCDVEFETKLSNAGFTPLPFGAGSWTQNPLYEQRNLVSYAVDRDSLERYSALNVAMPNGYLNERDHAQKSTIASRRRDHRG